MTAQLRDPSRLVERASLRSASLAALKGDQLTAEGETQLLEGVYADLRALDLAPNGALARMYLDVVCRKIGIDTPGRLAAIVGEQISSAREKAVQTPLLKREPAEVGPKRDDGKPPVASSNPKATDKGTGPAAVATPKSTDKAAPADSKRELTAAEELDEMMGQEEAKAQFQGIVALVEDAKEREREGLPVEWPNLNSQYKGPPGAGKTSFGRILGKFLREIGYFPPSDDDVLIEVNRKDLVLGEHTALNVAAAFDRAKYKVLLVDEAPDLVTGDNDQVGMDALNAIKALSENRRRETVVIMTGYPGKVDDLIKRDPGIPSRFPNIVNFVDCSDEVLAQILTGMVKRSGNTISPSLIKEAVTYLATLRSGRDWSNGRTVRNLFESAMRRRATRLKEKRAKTKKPSTRAELMRLERVDLLPKTPSVQIVTDEIKNLVGLENVKQAIEELVQIIAVTKDRGGDPREVVQPTFIFEGNDGVGKETIADMVARFFHRIGYLPEENLVKVNCRDLVAGYEGQTQEKAYKAMEKAIGGVLFIQNAPQLGGGPQGSAFKQQALDMVKQFIKENRGRLAVVLSGDAAGLKTFLEENQDLKAELANTIRFGDFSSKDCAELFMRSAKKLKFELATDMEAKLPAVFDPLRTLSGWANADDVESLVKTAARKQAMRIKTSGPTENKSLMVLSDIQLAATEMKQAKAS